MNTLQRLLNIVILGGVALTGDMAAALTLELLAEPGPLQNATVVFADTDHDGHGELIFESRSSSECCPVVFYESTDEGEYLRVNKITSGIAYAAGDLDRDGKSEVIGSAHGHIWMYEAVDANSHPTELVWESEGVSWSPLHLVVADSDRDGRQEMILTSDYDVIIFENDGNDSYSEVFRQTTTLYGSGQKVVADLDGDGSTEFIFGDRYGNVTVFENTGDDDWEQTWLSSLPMTRAERVKGGLDTDGNGRPEVFVAGGLADEPHTLVLEAIANDSFQIVATLAVEAGVYGQGDNALGNLDGVGGVEYVLQMGDHIHVFQAQSPGVWTEIESFRGSDLNPDWPGGYGIDCGDINGNGRDELVWMRGWLSEVPTPSTMILESPFVGTASPAGTVGFSVVTYPNPTSHWTTIELMGAASTSVTIRVIDARGRLVRTVEAGTMTGGQLRVLWDGTDDGGNQVASGVYRVAVSDGTVVETRKITFVR